MIASAKSTLREARPEHRDERNRQKQAWECQQRVDDPADGIVDKPPK